MTFVFAFFQVAGAREVETLRAQAGSIGWGSGGSYGGSYGGGYGGGSHGGGSYGGGPAAPTGYPPPGQPAPGATEMAESSEPPEPVLPPFGGQLPVSPESGIGQATTAAGGARRAVGCERRPRTRRPAGARPPTAACATGTARPGAIVSPDGERGPRRCGEPRSTVRR